MAEEARKIEGKVPGLVVSLDIDNLKEAVQILEKIDSQQGVVAVKIGTILCWRWGLKRVVEELKKVSVLPIIFDGQKAGTDIPEIVQRQVELVAASGVDAFICAPAGAGRDSLSSFVRACFSCRLIPLVVIEMSHKDWDAFLSPDACLNILEVSWKLGVESFVAPASRPERLKMYRHLSKEKGKEMIIFSPGIGEEGEKVKEAVKAGADFIIVGRAIYQTEQPSQKVRDLYKKVKEGYVEREGCWLSI